MPFIDYSIASRCSGPLLPKWLREFGGLSERDVALIGSVAAGQRVSRAELRRAMVAFSEFWIVAACVAAFCPLIIILPLAMAGLGATVVVPIATVILFVFFYAGSCLVTTYVRFALLPQFFGLTHKGQPASESNLPYGLEPRVRDGYVNLVFPIMFCVVFAFATLNS